MKKILIVSTVSRQFYLFEQTNIETLKSLGYEVHAAANYKDANERLDDLEIIRHHFNIERSPFSLQNLNAYRELIKVMKVEKFDAVHCHSPMGGVLARLASKAIGITPVIYTAHGFHFYSGAPIINWLLYYPVEKYLSKFTDILITINREDFSMAKNLKAKKVKYVPGIGVETKKTTNISKINKRKELGLPLDSFLLTSVGELNKNKNHEVIIKAMAKLKDTKIFYIICGQGNKLKYLQLLSKKLGVEDRVKFLGFRNDVYEIYQMSDVFVFPSIREGLSASLMEAMSAGLPVICSDIRGNKDLVKNAKGGYLLKSKDVSGFSKSIEKLKNNKELRKNMGKQNQIEVENYSKDAVKGYMREIYSNL